MYLKIMDNDGAPDGDSRKTFAIFDKVAKVKFGRKLDDEEAKKPEHRLVANHAPFADVTFDDMNTEKFWIEGNCYLMNEAGVTIASFGVAPYVEHFEHR